MKDLSQPLELVEKMILETRHIAWVALNIGGCGILTRAVIGRHARESQESRRIALAFAHYVVQAIGFSPSHDSVSTPQTLIDAADAIIDDPEHVFLLGTTWRCLPEGVEICSVGSNSVLIFEKDTVTVREGIIPHTVTELLRSQGKKLDPRYRRLVTHALGSRKNQKSCLVDDIQVTLVPFLPTTTIAIIEDWRLANAIIQHTVPQDELPSFIEAWNPPGKRIRTSVLISL